MAKITKSKRKRAPKTALKLPDLEQSKSAVFNSLTSFSSQRPYDHAIREFINWYYPEARLAFNKIVLTRYRISLEQRHYVDDQPKARGGSRSRQSKSGFVTEGLAFSRNLRQSEYLNAFNQGGLQPGGTLLKTISK